MSLTADAEPPGLIAPAAGRPNPGRACAGDGNIIPLRLARALGRAADLESHVCPDWWRTIFDELYLKTDGDVFENENNTRAEINSLIGAAKLHPSDRILDLCCGQGRHSLELARRGFTHPTGIDQSSYLISLARERARDAGADIAFIEADARLCRIPERQFDCVMMLGNCFGWAAATVPASTSAPMIAAK